MEKTDLIIYKKYLDRLKNERGEKIIKCKVLDNLAGKSPEELLERAGLLNTVPIDLRELLKYWNVSALPINFRKIQKSDELKDEVREKGNIFGAVAIKNDSACIFFRKRDRENRKRFIIAHELSHCCIDYDNLNKNGINYRFEKINKEDEHEIAINTHAGAILIPEKTLRLIHNQIKCICVLADIFCVSQNVMTERLKVLKMTY